MLDVTDKLTVDSAGSITNSSNDYTIDEEGYSVATQETYSDPKSYKVVDDGGTTIGAFWGSDTRIVLDGRGNNLRIESNGGRVQMSTASRFIRIIDGQDIDIETSNGDLNINGAGSLNIESNGGTNINSYINCRDRFRLPRFTDATRPSNPDPGEIIYNTDAGGIQIAGNGGNWGGV